MLLGRHRSTEKYWDFRFWKVVEFYVNSKISDESKRIKPEQVFPSLGQSRGTGLPEVSARESFEQVAKQFNATRRRS